MVFGLGLSLNLNMSKSAFDSLMCVLDLDQIWVYKGVVGLGESYKRLGVQASMAKNYLVYVQNGMFLCHKVNRLQIQCPCSLLYCQRGFHMHKMLKNMLYSNQNNSLMRIKMENE